MKRPNMERLTMVYQENQRIMHHSIVVLFLVFTSTINFIHAQPTPIKCDLNFNVSSFTNASVCEGGDWDGFLSSGCCKNAFEEYLYRLSQRANQTRRIYLNSIEQTNCLDSMKAFGGNLSECGIGRLSGGRGGCSDYGIVDVENKMGDALRNLENGCEFSMGVMDSWCDVCSRRWEEMRASLDDLCRFAVLVTLTSHRIDDETWVRSVYKCLGGKNSIGDEDLSDGNKRNRNIMSRGLWILTGSLIATLLLIILALWHMLKQPKSKLSQEKHDSKDGLAEDLTQSISSKEIYSATNNLNPVNFIGQGIAGKVYKGVLSNGLGVAIKHIIKDGHVETFVREVTSLSHVRHPNLVTLLGYCDEEDDCFLVYELCANGNLSEWLFGKEKVLPWTRRLEIAIDSARGLWFLHTYPEGCIVHRDIKPTNILLGTNFEAKLSDFGLSKIIDSGASYVSSEVRGTFGYVDPEYRQNHHVNPSGDVYSFGIVLLQILSGQRVINLNVKRPMPLDRMAKLLTRGGKITDFVDPKLSEEFSKEAFELTMKLALSCTAHKQQRPSMERVVAMLEEALYISTRELVHETRSTLNKV